MPTRRRVLAGVAGLAGTSVVADSGDAADAPAAPERTWHRTYSPVGDGSAHVRAVEPAGDGVAVAGIVEVEDRYRGWVGRLDAAGRVDSHYFTEAGGSGFYAAAPAPGDSSGILAAGTANIPAGVRESGLPDPYVVRVDPGEGVAWTRTYQPATPGGDAAALAALDEGYVVAGSGTVDGHARPWAAGLDGEGTRTWTWQGDRAGTASDAVGAGDGVVLGGSTWPPDADSPSPRLSQEAAWVGKLTGGEAAWTWRVDRGMGDRVESLAPRPGGGVVGVGRRGFGTDSEGTAWLVALDAGGDLAWERTYPRDHWDSLHALAAVDGGYVLAGTREGAPDTGARQAWLVGVDADGRVNWEHRADPGTRAYTVRALDDGGVLVGGDRRGDGSAPDDGWLAKLGGDPARGSGGGLVDGLNPPSLPGWSGPLLAGGALGAVGTAAFSRWRN